MSVTRHALRVLVALLACVPVTGCATLSWYGEAAVGQMRILAARRPVDEVLADPSTAPETAANLMRVDAILEFAEHELGLPVGGRYRTYVALDRDAVVWNVFAAPEFSLTPHQWCYPVVGCAVYRGFFDRDGARREAVSFAARGFDVHVGPVAAYSTLGWFDDPLLSTFIGYSDERLAELLFHELAHGELFVPGDSDFSEAFATFVGREATSAWLFATGRNPEPYLAAKQAARTRANFFQAWRARLGTLYAQELPADQRRLLKGALFDEMRACYAERGRRFGSGFGGTLPGALNNARLAATSTYEDRTPAFAVLFARLGGNWEAFYRAAREIADREPGARHALLRDLAREHATVHRPEPRDALVCRRPAVRG
ncbi:MAG: aminopeptidase [Gammaproteobacteria bacterium]|nr:aminopeptidase [Gammaproteobacteria bacterium]